MHFMAVTPAVPAFWHRQYRYVVSPVTGRRMKKRVRAFKDSKGRSSSRTPMNYGGFRHDGRWINYDDVIESDRDLSAAFPDRFQRVEE